MEWIYVRYGGILPRGLKMKQDKMQATYNTKYSIEIMFNQMEMGQEFAIAGNLPSFNRKMSDMGVARSFLAQEYTHEYRMWKSIAAYERTWVSFKEMFQEENLGRDKLEKQQEWRGMSAPTT